MFNSINIPWRPVIAGVVVEVEFEFEFEFEPPPHEIMNPKMNNKVIFFIVF